MALSGTAARRSVGKGNLGAFPRKCTHTYYARLHYVLRLKRSYRSIAGMSRLTVVYKSPC